MSAAVKPRTRPPVLVHLFTVPLLLSMYPPGRGGAGAYGA